MFALRLHKDERVSPQVGLTIHHRLIEASTHSRRAGNGERARTVAEKLHLTEVDIKVADGSVMIDGATVVQTDISTTNGVIHVIDSVILPN